MASKIRLDVALVDKGFAESREKAKAMIMAGIVFVNNQFLFWIFCFVIIFIFRSGY